APVRPKGSVRRECSHLIISRVVPMLRNKAMDDFIVRRMVSGTVPAPCGSYVLRTSDPRRSRVGPGTCAFTRWAAIDLFRPSRLALRGSRHLVQPFRP